MVVIAAETTQFKMRTELHVMCILYQSCTGTCIYELRIKNRSESDLCNSEATKAVAKKVQKQNLKLQHDLNSQHLRYWCDALPTEL